MTQDIQPPKSWLNREKHFSDALEHPWYKLIFSLTGSIFYSTIDFFRAEGFSPALTPITTNAISSPGGLGSDSLPVNIQIFNKNTYLADSMQFHLEYLLRHKVKGVYYVMPTFRGEDPDSRHLNQFFHSEAEMVGELSDVMNLIERYISKCASDALENFGDSLKRATGDIAHIVNLLRRCPNQIPIVSFYEAKRMLGDDSLYYSLFKKKPIRLSELGEKRLLEKTGGSVWITEFPRIGAPFYQATNQQNDTSLCADLLLGIGETVGCGQRNIDSDETLEELSYRNIDPSKYEWYLRMKKDYPMQTAGFGMGIERFILWLLVHDDIRDTQIMTRLKDIDSAF